MSDLLDQECYAICSAKAFWWCYEFVRGQPSSSRRSEKYVDDTRTVHVEGIDVRVVLQPNARSPHIFDSDKKICTSKPSQRQGYSR